MRCISIRGQAWAFRNRAQVAALSPDGTPEKGYFDKLTKDFIAISEGERGITGTSLQNTPEWRWGHEVIRQNMSPLHFWEPGNNAFVQAEVDPAKASAGISTWEQNFMMYALGRAKELGYPTDALVSWLAVNIVGQIIDPGYDPYLIAANRTPTTGRDGKFFKSWAEVKASVKKDNDAKKSFVDKLEDADHGYSIVAIAAVAAAANQPGGREAWDWITKNAITAAKKPLNDNPKWAVLPRT